MSQMDDDSYTSNKNTGLGSIIEETDSETSVDHTKLDDISILPVKKKPARILASDEDESDLAASISQSSHDENKSTSLHSKSGSYRRNTTKRIQDILSSSDSEADEPTRKIESLVSTSEGRDRTDTPQSAVELAQTDEDISLSMKLKNSNISQQFQFNSKGILNSTAIDGGAQEKRTEFRLSHNLSNIRETNEESSESSVEILSDHDSDVIEVSSDERSPKKTPFKLQTMKSAARQQTLHSFIVKKEPPTPQQKKPGAPTEQLRQPLSEIKTTSQQNAESPKVAVSRAEYQAQWNKVNNLQVDYVKLQSMMENINYEALPDNGQLIKERLRIAENRYLQEKEKLDKMDVSDTKVEEAPQGAFSNVAWEDIEAGANAVLPKTFGKIAMSTYNAQKAVTLDRLQQLHGALQSCPKEEDYEEDPKGIKVPLMPHQKRALAWVLFREKEKPAGGILADDMGLGKTLTMLSLIVKSLQMEASDSDSDEENQYIGKNTKYDGGSLVVCPASLINQWSGEIDKRLKRGLLSYELYHGPKRESSAKRLAKYDVVSNFDIGVMAPKVITTYAIVNNEADRQSALSKIRWRRVILDEAHTIRNYKAQTSVACCQLLANARWALTGTPMHNKELDMYALLKFLRCSPFDDLQVWKRWVGDKSSGGMERLHTVISSLMLRRTKAELIGKGSLTCLPEKKWELVKVELDEDELRVYHKVLIFSQTLFAQFLHQRAEKNQDYVDQKFTNVPNQAPNQEYFKMRQKLLRLNKVKDVSQHEILVLLLRLRQICCHPSLITAMLDENREDIGEDDKQSHQLNLLDQLENLNIEDDEDQQHDDTHKPGTSHSAVAEGLSQDQRITLKEASRGHLRPSDPVFAKERASSKIKTMLKVLREVISKGDKAIIVSQWSSYLKLVAMHLRNNYIKFDQLDGQVPVVKRMAIVNRFNDPKDEMVVLLLSLTAGGVGLNLVGANHLFLLDLHWNPQLENQAQDRIYRVGQTKPVCVYKFMAIDTIEERIKALQDKKLAMAEGLLTGTKQAIQSKLSMQDLRMIFGM